MPIAVKLTIHVENIHEILELFDRIQIWRSITGDIGIYNEVTANLAEPAHLLGTVAGPWSLVGKNLIMEVSGADPITFSFTGTDPLDLATALAQINTSSLAYTAGINEIDPSKIMLSSKQVGGGASLLLQVSSGATTLGLPLTKGNGKAARIFLTEPTTDYSFIDLDGFSTYWYKTRLYSTLTGGVGAFSDPVQGVPESVFFDSSMSIATVKIADASGRPIAGRRIIFVPLSLQKVTGYQILPQQDRVIFETNSLGISLIKLVRKGVFKVLFEGSGFEREIAIPDAPTFDLFSLISAAPDSFTIAQSPPLPIRSS